MSTLLHAPDGLRPWVRRLASWLLLALMLATLAPAISRTFITASSHDGHTWVDICSASGTQRVLLENLPGSEPRKSDPGTALDLCAHCTLAAERFAPIMPACYSVGVCVSSWCASSEPVIFSKASPSLHAEARGPPLAH